MIEFINVTKTYHMGKSEFQALKGVSFKIERGEKVAIVGPSGSGKSTTMHIIGLLDHPTSGQYLFKDKETKNLDQNELAALRNRAIGFVFQQFFLLPRLSAWENVGMPLFYRQESPKVLKQKALSILEKVEMAEYATHKPNELSGGQQQRVAIARALVGEPNIILADEPTGALDTTTSSRILELLLTQSTGTTVVIITHDHSVAESCERIIYIQDGLIKI